MYQNVNDSKTHYNVSKDVLEDFIETFIIFFALFQITVPVSCYYKKQKE